MSEPTEAVRRYAEAVKDPTADHLDALGDVVADDVVVVGLAGAGVGLEAVCQALENPQMPGLFSNATLSEPIVEGNTGTIEMALPAGMPIAGLLVHVRFDGERITRVEQEMLPAPPPPATDLRLNDDIKGVVAGAVANGTPMVLSYVDADGAPHLSLRGSTQPYGDTQLAIWVRDPAGGLLKAIVDNPRVALFYRDPATRAAYQFSGRARAETDPEVREVVYTNAPETRAQHRRQTSRRPDHHRSRPSGGYGARWSRANGAAMTASEHRIK